MKSLALFPVPGTRRRSVAAARAGLWPDEPNGRPGDFEMRRIRRRGLQQRNVATTFGPRSLQERNVAATFGLRSLRERNVAATFGLSALFARHPRAFSRHTPSSFALLRSPYGQPPAGYLPSVGSRSERATVLRRFVGVVFKDGLAPPVIRIVRAKPGASSAARSSSLSSPRLSSSSCTTSRSIKSHSSATSSSCGRSIEAWAQR